MPFFSHSARSSRVIRSERASYATAIKSAGATGVSAPVAPSGYLPARAGCRSIAVRSSIWSGVSA